MGFIEVYYSGFGYFIGYYSFMVVLAGGLKSGFACRVLRIQTDLMRYGG